ncbi:rRNA-processing protein [Starmerella bacillaris]|uniref:U3 small nucleolar ribonucleoprotein protein MPP10 n=1 Tax=Starmerella bacillaris TaxID=1247836 RepID=A0AAV5RJ28_STABA|nr:rRNA-processing protein [Starmerella bacillaris]
MTLYEKINKNPESLLIPNADFQTEVLDNLKSTLDPIAAKYSPLDAVHTAGLKAEQVWVQVQMVLESASAKLAADFNELGGVDGSESSEDSDEAEAGNESLEDSEDYENFEEDAENVEDIEDEIQEDSHMDIDMDGNDDEDLALIDADNIVDDYDELEGNNEEELDDGDNNVEDEDNDDEVEEGETGDSKEDNFDITEFQQHVMQLENLDNEEAEDDDEEIDYSKPVPESDSDDVDMRYNDFFAPPKQVRKPRVRFEGAETKVLSDNNDELDLEERLEEDIADVFENTTKDLFDEDDDSEDEEKGLSKFEIQQREIARQIEDLENENVGEKSWGMKGEIKAKERPEESLISADIIFDRSAKPAPVITEESTQSLEDMIKERIRKQNFDDIPRRTEANLPTEKKELADLSQSKNQKSLAEMYEEDHLRAENPDFYAKQDSSALTAAHKEVVDMFNAVNHSLDALCSFQYTPRAPATTLDIVTDQPTTAVEDAQPGTMTDASQFNSRLAPQEIYKGESIPMSNSEMSSSLKRKKRRDKAQSRKQKSEAAASTKKGSKDEIFNTLKRGNVTVFDKRGTKRDLKGNNKSSTEFDTNASFIKL